MRQWDSGPRRPDGTWVKRDGLAAFVPGEMCPRCGEWVTDICRCSDPGGAA